MIALFISQAINLVIGSFIISLTWNHVVVEMFEISTMSYGQALLVMLATEALCAMPIRDVEFMRLSGRK